MLKGKTICIVGVFGQERKDLEVKIQSERGMISSHVSKSTWCLVTSPENKSKTKSLALRYGIPIKSNLDEFLRQDNKRNPIARSYRIISDDEDEEDVFPGSAIKKKVRISSPPLTTNQTCVLPKIDPKYLFTAVFQLKYPIIDRKNASEELALQLLLQKTEEKGVLPILSQTFGIGKTSLVNNFRTLLSENSITFPDFPANVVNSLMDSIRVNIDLLIILHRENEPMGNLLAKGGIIFTRFLKSLRRQLESQHQLSPHNENIAKSFRVIMQYLNLGGICTDTAIQTCVSSLQNLDMCDFLYEWSDLKLVPLILFFDEAQSLEKDTDEEIIEFWNRFIPLFGTQGSEPKCERIFIVMAGKSASLTLLGRGIRQSPVKTSPSPACHIVLDLLQEHHIIQLFQQAIVSSTSITMEQFLQSCNIGDNFGYLCKLVKEYTGGIPRMVLHLIISITSYCKNNNLLDLSSRDKIDRVFNNTEIMSKVLALPEANPLRELGENRASFKIYRQLCVFGALGIPINIEKRTIKLIYDINVGLEVGKQDEAKCFMLKIPKLCELDTNSVPSIDILRNVFSHGFDISQITDKGTLLDVLTRDNLILRLMSYMHQKKDTLWFEIHPCFSKTSLLTNVKISLSKDFLKFMPKVVTNGTHPRKVEEIREISERRPWDYNVVDSDWPKIKTVFFQGNCFVHPAPRSRSSDLFFNVPPNKVLCFAMKNYLKTDFSFQALQEEIDKAFLMMQSKEGNSFTDIALFLMYNGIEVSDINNYCVDDHCLVITGGKYEFINNEMRRIGEFKPDLKMIRTTPRDIHNYDSKYALNMVFVPPNMEVVVLGSEAIKTFFTEQDLTQLHILSENYPNVDYLENFFNSYDSIGI